MRRTRALATTIALTAGLLGGLAALPAAAATGAPHDDTVIDVTDANYAQVIAMSKTTPVVLDFNATWCEPCQEENPYLQQYHDADHGKWIWAKVDVSDGTTNEDIANKYGVEFIPSLIDISQGQEKGSRMVGFDTGSSPANLRTWLNNL